MKSATATGEPWVVVPLKQILERFRANASDDDFSVVLETPCLIVDLVDAEPLSEADAGLLRTSLSRLATPSIGVVPDSRHTSVTPTADSFDVLAASSHDLELLVESCRSRPLASLALVQLLRQGEGLDVHQGLVSESWVYSMLQSGPEFEAWITERGRAARSDLRSTTAAVTSARDGDRLRISLNRPEKRNAFSAAMRDGLCEALMVAQSDRTIREIVLTGAGESFCAGGDLDEFGSFPDPATAHAVRSTRNAARMMSLVGDRIRAEVHGACVGAGVELPAFAKRVVAHPSAFFQLPEIQMGLIPGAGGTVSIRRRVGRQRTAWLALSGERIDAETALAWNLIDELHD